MADDFVFFLFIIGAKKLIGASEPLTRFAFHLMSILSFYSVGFIVQKKTIQQFLIWTKIDFCGLIMSFDHIKWIIQQIIHFNSIFE